MAVMWEEKTNGVERGKKRTNWVVVGEAEAESVGLV